jgi:Multicopper oxidase
VITGNGTVIGDPGDPGRLFVNAAHPIHMHGHDFAILGRGFDAYNEETDPLTFTYDNPPRRDVALLPVDGWLAVAFRSDNPGVWLVHCHIAWHASSGLALQMLERQSEIVKMIGPERLDATKKTCAGWDTWLADGEQINQEDSGTYQLILSLSFLSTRTWLVHSVNTDDVHRYLNTRFKKIGRGNGRGLVYYFTESRTVYQCWICVWIMQCSVRFGFLDG